jgi:hypothetical protein
LIYCPRDNLFIWPIYGTTVCHINEDDPSLSVAIELSLETVLCTLGQGGSLRSTFAKFCFTWFRSSLQNKIQFKRKWATTEQVGAVYNTARELTHNRDLPTHLNILKLHGTIEEPLKKTKSESRSAKKKNFDVK